MGKSDDPIQDWLYQPIPNKLCITRLFRVSKASLEVATFLRQMFGF